MNIFTLCKNYVGNTKRDGEYKKYETFLIFYKSVVCGNWSIDAMCSVQQEIDNHIRNNRRGRKVEIICNMNVALFKEIYTSSLLVTLIYFILTGCRDK